MPTIAVVGGGAAGFFAALACAEQRPQRRILILERSAKLLTKVGISGGGRCNVTHHCFDPDALAANYPRGGRTLRALFRVFGAREAVAWFEERGVRLKVEADGRMFPVTDSSSTVIDCFLREARRAGVEIRTRAGVEAVEPGPPFRLRLSGGETVEAERVLIATGGAPRRAAFEWLERLGHRIEPPVPSLFTFNTPGSPLRGLQGVSVPHAEVRVEGTKLVETGPLLLTHWGFSGPAVLRLSAWGARALHAREYRFTVLVGWVPGLNDETLRAALLEERSRHPARLVAAHPLFDLPARLWKTLAAAAGLPESVRWADLPRPLLHRLVETLLRSRYAVEGKTTYKEEFVTCGGVDLRDVNPATMESRRCQGLFFAGEVLDVDGVTGGFNFQSAWTTGYVAGRAIAGDST